MSKNILIVAAHPDDEVLGCGGTIKKHSMNGDNVTVLFMTTGVGARKNNLTDVKRRKQAARKVKNILGIKKLIFLNLPDNEMDSLPLLKIIKKIEKVVFNLNPEIIYTHFSNDLNIDHEITFRAVMTACRPKPKMKLKKIIVFEVLSSTDWQINDKDNFVPNFFSEITNVISFKRKALEAYHFEMYEPPHTRSIVNQITCNKVRGASVGLEYAEAFKIIRFID